MMNENKAQALPFKGSIEAAKKLSEIREDADIIQLSHAIFPGTHCPLFGALMVSSYVKDLAVLNIGTEECTFYGKDFARLRQKGKDLVFSLVTHKNDITFGMHEKIKNAVQWIVEMHQPKAILLISTCVVELIGEDVGAVTETLESAWGIPILFVKTEHFKCNSHIPGISDTMAMLVKLMEKKEKQHHVINVLGHRFDGFAENELAKLLEKYGVSVNMSIPSDCSATQLREAGHASLNIVTDFTALPLAKAMAEKLDQPYVLFEKQLMPERILQGYAAIGKYLDLDWMDEVEQMYNHAVQTMAFARKALEGQRFIYGNTPMKALECAHFFCELGMKALWVQMRELYADDTGFIADILATGNDPKVSRIANIIPMRDVYDLYQPDVYIGHESPMILIRKNIKQLTFDQEASALGFQLTLGVIEKIKQVYQADSSARMHAMGSANPHSQSHPHLQSHPHAARHPKDVAGHLHGVSKGGFA